MLSYTTLPDLYHCPHLPSCVPHLNRPPSNMLSPEVNFEALAGILRQLSDCLEALNACLLTLKTKPPPPAAKAPSTSPSTPVASKPS